MEESGVRIPIISIGNSRGIRIPQAVLKQVGFGEEVEMFVSEGKLTLKRCIDPNRARDFSAIAALDDVTIQRTLLKISGSDLVIALVGADEAVKEAVYRNLSDPVKNYVVPRVEQLERGDARDMMIERSRSAVSEAIIEVLRE
jgi:antitoxin component of MazEF toxin-antitoxin module